MKRTGEGGRLYAYPPRLPRCCCSCCCKACSISSLLSRPPARPIEPPPSTMKACAFIAALVACATKSLAFVAPLQSSTLTFSSPRSSLAAAATATSPAVSHDHARREAHNGNRSGRRVGWCDRRELAAAVLPLKPVRGSVGCRCVCQKKHERRP